MAITSLTCPEPIARRQRVVAPDYDALHEANALFDEGQPEKALRRTLDHLFPGREVPNLRDEPFSFVQGSSRVTVGIDGDEVTAKVPLVRLRDDSLTTAALRYLLTDVSGIGVLFQPLLVGNDVHLVFRDRLPRLHPQKVIEVLRQMPLRADAKDDWLIEEFSCEPLERAPLDPLADDELERAVSLWQTHWREVDELAKESQRKRSTFFFDEVAAYALYHVRQALPLHGYWWSRLSSASDTFNGNRVPMDDRERSLMKCAKEMVDLDADRLRNSLGHATYAISPLSEGDERVLRHHLGPGNYLDAVMSVHNAGRYMDAAVALVGTYCYLLARYSWEDPIERLLLEGVKTANGQAWRACASALLAQSRKLMDALDEDGEDDEPEEGEPEDAENGEEEA